MTELSKDQEFAAHVRREFSDDAELRASLETFGWHRELPAIVDEGGVVLVGNRRLRIAREQGIEPIVKTIAFGSGSAADAERIKLALVSNLGAAPLAPKDRQRIAERLYGDKGWTMARIGTALGVSQATISGDLHGLSTPDKPPRPKGGRPKKPQHVAERQQRIIDLADDGLQSKDIADAVGVGERMVHRVLEVESARREGPAPSVDAAMLSASAREKLDAAMRAHKRKLDAEFEARVLEECRKRLDELSLPAHAKQLQDAQDVLHARRKGIMPRSVFRLILSCLHPDSRRSVSDKKLNEAFHEFEKRERVLLSEQDDPTSALQFPRTWTEAQEWKRKVREQRKASKNTMARL